MNRHPESSGIRQWWRRGQGLAPGGEQMHPPRDRTTDGREPSTGHPHPQHSASYAEASQNLSWCSLTGRCSGPADSTLPPEWKTCHPKSSRKQWVLGKQQQNGKKSHLEETSPTTKFCWTPGLGTMSYHQPRHSHSPRSVFFSLPRKGRLL